MAETAEQIWSFDGPPPSYEALLAASQNPVPSSVMREMAGSLPLHQGSTVVDVACYDASQSAPVAGRFGCRLVGVDLAAHGPLHQRESDGAVGVGFLRGRMQAIPLRDGIADLTWCRDALSCAPASETVPELARITRAGGSLLVHTTCATPWLESCERRRLFDVLGLSPDSMDEATVVRLFAASGLQVIAHVRLGNQSLQHRLETDPASSGVLGVARLVECPERFIAAWGIDWYERILALESWSLYLALGKLEDHIWQLRRPG